MSPFQKSPKKTKRVAGVGWSKEDEVGLVEYVALHQDFSYLSPDGCAFRFQNKKVTFWDTLDMFQT